MNLYMLLFIVVNSFYIVSLRINELKLYLKMEIDLIIEKQILKLKTIK